MAEHGARKITNRGRRDRVIDKFMSVKMRKAIWWESQLERDYCYFLEYDRDVIAVHYAAGSHGTDDRAPIRGVLPERRKK